jgi:hypothetical protein
LGLKRRISPAGTAENVVLGHPLRVYLRADQLGKEALYEGHGFSRATPVLVDEGFRVPNPKSPRSCFVSRHDFSRAVKDGG